MKFGAVFYFASFNFSEQRVYLHKIAEKEVLKIP